MASSSDESRDPSPEPEVRKSRRDAKKRKRKNSSSSDQDSQSSEERKYGKDQKHTKEQKHANEGHSSKEKKQLAEQNKSKDQYKSKESKRSKERNPMKESSEESSDGSEGKRSGSREKKFKKKSSRYEDEDGKLSKDEKSYKSGKSYKDEKSRKDEKSYREERSYKEEKFHKSEKSYRDEKSNKAEKSYRDEKSYKNENSSKNEKLSKYENLSKNEKGSKNENSSKNEKASKNENLSKNKKSKDDKREKDEKSSEDEEIQNEERSLKDVKSNKDEKVHKNEKSQGDDKSSKPQKSSSKHSSEEHRESSEERRPRKRKYRDLDKPQENYPRYYGDDPDKRRDNSDTYWTKYPKKDDNIVGSRYYDHQSKKPDDKTSPEPEKKDDNQDKSVITPRQRKTVDLLTSKTGGAYIPPAKLRMMQAEITDKTSAAYQRIAWEALKKSVHGHINKVNTSNIGIIAKELLRENIVRGRGLLCRSIIQAQAASPTFTNVYAALVGIINSKFPNIGELLLKRLVLQFKRGFKQNNKNTCITSATFIAHLVNQRVAHEILALEILTLLVETPTDDSVEVAISFLKECGQKLTEVSSKGINAIFEMLRNILHEGQLEKRIQYMIEVMFQIRKDGFKDHAAITEDLDLVEEEDQITHLIMLDDVKAANSEDILNVFKFDDAYEENEGKYKTLSKEILDTDSESGSGSEEGSGDSDDSDDEDEEEEKEESKIIDNTETNLITLRRTIYLTIQSSLDFEECAHKLMKMELKPGQGIELCHMFLDCCAEQRTYEKFYGLLAQRFCQINKIYVEPFQQIFKDTYSTTHRLDANRLRNVSKFFAHLLFTDAISWEVFEIMKLNEADTNSSSRIFIKILFQELAEYMGLGKLNARLKDPTFHESFTGLFPRDNPKNTRFSINFFTSIGLGGLTDELREHLKSAPKMPVVVEEKDSDDSSSLGSSSSSSDSTSSSSSSSSDSSSDSDDDKKKKKKKKKKKVKSGVEEEEDDKSRSWKQIENKSDRGERNSSRDWGDRRGFDRRGSDRGERSNRQVYDEKRGDKENVGKMSRLEVEQGDERRSNRKEEKWGKDSRKGYERNSWREHGYEGRKRRQDNSDSRCYEKSRPREREGRDKADKRGREREEIVDRSRRQAERDERYHRRS